MIIKNMDYLVKRADLKNLTMETLGNSFRKQIESTSKHCLYLNPPLYLSQDLKKCLKIFKNVTLMPTQRQEKNS